MIITDIYSLSLSLSVSLSLSLSYFFFPIFFSFNFFQMEIYELYRQDPDKWSIPVLAKKFGVKRQRVEVRSLSSSSLTLDAVISY